MARSVRLFLLLAVFPVGGVVVGSLLSNRPDKADGIVMFLAGGFCGAGIMAYVVMRGMTDAVTAGAEALALSEVYRDYYHKLLVAVNEAVVILMRLPATDRFGPTRQGIADIIAKLAAVINDGPAGIKHTPNTEGKREA